MDRDEARAEVAAALTSLDVEVKPSKAGSSDASPRGTINAAVDGQEVTVDLEAFSRVRLSDALGLVRRLEPARGPSRRVFVAADRIDAAAATELVEAGFGYWDRATRRLVLRAPGVRIDTVVDRPQITAVVERADAGVPLRSPFSGVGVRVGYWLLTHPDEPLGVRAVARAVGASATQVSAVARALQRAHLLDPQRRVPDLPALFWELSEHWAPAWSRSLVATERAVLEGGVIVGTLAAVAYGAPAVVGGAAPSLYLPHQAFVPEPPSAAGPASGVRVAVAPAPGAAAPWGPPLPLPDGTLARPAHPVAIALDLATDRGRGREILAGWDLHPETAPGARRVW